MSTWNIDGVIVDDDGVIYDGLEGHTIKEKVSILMSKLDSHQRQKKEWEASIAIIKAAIDVLLKREQLDGVEDRSTALRVGYNHNSSASRAYVENIRTRIEITDADWAAMIAESYSTLAPKAFQEAAHKIGIPMEEIEGAIQTTEFIQLRTVRRTASMREIK